MRYSRYYVEPSAGGVRVVRTGFILGLLGFLAKCMGTIIAFAPTWLIMFGVWSLTHTTWVTYAVGVPVAIGNALVCRAIKHAIRKGAL